MDLSIFGKFPETLIHWQEKPAAPPRGRVFGLVLSSLCGFGVGGWGVAEGVGSQGLGQVFKLGMHVTGKLGFR